MATVMVSSSSLTCKSLGSNRQKLCTIDATVSPRPQLATRSCLASSLAHTARQRGAPATAALGCRRSTAATCHAAAAAGLDAAVESEDDNDVCMPPDITVDNAEHDQFSIVTIEVKGYPGMFRVIAWVLSGLMLDVHNATLCTDADGIVTNRFWLTDMSGKKLSDGQLEAVAERITDYVSYCTPDESAAKNATKFSHGPITVDNAQDEAHSVVTIFAPGRRQERLPRNALLEIASCINGCGLKIHRAEIQGCSDCGVPIENDDFPEAAASGARLYRFWATDREDKKLDMGRASALLYTMNLMYGSGNGARSGSTTPPRPMI